MGSEWRNITLGDFVALQRGHDLTAEERRTGHVPVFGAAGHNGYHDTAIAKGPGIVVGRSGGSFGQVHYSKEDFWPHNTGLYVKDFKGNDPRFAFYLLTALDFDSYNSGSAQPSLNRNFIYPIPVRVPPPIEQKAISRVLSNLDDEIELNHRINAELEGMAKLLYDYWFVQFDFPDANGKPYQSSGGKMVYNPTLKREIPEGWEAISVSEFAAIKTGKEDANYATDDGVFHFFTCGEAALRCNDFVFDGKAVLLAGNGSFAVKKYEGKFNAYQRTYVLIPNDENLFAPLYFVVLNRISTFTSGSRGSIVKFITKGDIEDIFLPLPRSRELDFTSILSSLFSQSARLYEENIELTNLRDWLLPMLMNGQVTVE